MANQAAPRTFDSRCRVHNQFDRVLNSVMDSLNQLAGEFSREVYEEDSARKCLAAQHQSLVVDGMYFVRQARDLSEDQARTLSSITKGLQELDWFSQHMGNVNYRYSHDRIGLAIATQDDRR